MPNLDDVRKKILEGRTSIQDDVRRGYLKNLSETTQRDTILYASEFATRKQSSVPYSICLEDLQGFMGVLHGLKRKELDLILHSPGGTLEAADQIVQYLRSKYEHIRAIVPQNAMSAATMIACACDEILLGRHSALGPIDPQFVVPTAKGSYHVVGANELLDEFEKAKQDVLVNANLSLIWDRRLEEFPPGILTQCENVIQLAISKVGDWLNRYMFKGSDDSQKAHDIAKWLGTTSNHLSHGRPIMFDDLEQKGLTVKRIEENQELQEGILSVFHATMVTFEVTPCMKIIENHLGHGRYLNAEGFL